MLSLSVEQLVKRLKDGSVSAQEVCKMCLKRAQSHQQLNAFLTLLEAPALSKAEECDKKFMQRRAEGVLFGVPVAVKDNFCTKGIRTTCSSAMLESFVPTYNATVVDRLEKEGSYCIGKTNLDEFAMGSGTVDSKFGPTFNIWKAKSDVENNKGPRVAGGSSGGSAVAVASGAAFVGIGSDSGGSTRNPASYCGLVGYKPTYSSVSRHGLIPLVNSMDVPGIITKKVRDAAIVYNSVCGHDSKDSTTVGEVNKIPLPDRDSVKGLRVGIPIEYHCEGLSDEVSETWESVAKLLEGAGAVVKEVSMKSTEFSLPVYSILNQCEVASNMSRYDGLKYGYRHPNSENSMNELLSKSRSTSFGSAVRARILIGNYFLLSRNYEKYFVKAMKVRRLICDDFKSAWKNFDVLLTPTTLTEAPLFEDFVKLSYRTRFSLNDFCTQPANMSGCPAVSIPIKLSKNQLPLSLQLMAPNYADNLLLSVAHFIEHQVSFPFLKINDN